MRIPTLILLVGIATGGAVATAAPSATTEHAANMTELFLIPHTHADVGWLETVNALARMNVSRILDGVVANLKNDTLKRRRFVWDEMAFLEKWWDAPDTTDAQRADFTAFVHEGRIELADNGWSQHDNGCTTLDGMVNNWMEGHQWLKARGLPMPKVGWSLDPPVKILQRTFFD